MSTSNNRFDIPDFPDNIELPLPPKINIYSLLSKRKLPDGTSKRIPNAFIIYRMSLHHELVSKGYKYSLSQVSSMASKAWKNESKEVKQEYNNLVNNARVLESSLNDESYTTNYNNATIGENQLFSQGDRSANVSPTPVTIAGPYTPSEFITSENPLFLNHIDSYFSLNNLDANNILSIDERLRVLEERQKLIAERIGIKF
ncbi:hypothetical protein RclHR1_13750005 [Rhizophagus clarus]|uniref:HMG box domain-containing protein n=1 Tax=Rhizophagus clarus TaxID=94130 RepID=A0A2Z6QAZ4_9GLOM|nr:hypothetical protein RclHR1_13750005 [Rhizophagus clarus]GES78137.1 hypothetical protein GLOIN_2v1846371 [Rhizophagus clarus]